MKNRIKGFTLVELLIAMAITGIVAGAIFTAFLSQQKSYLIQDQVTEMQQNLRAEMDIMVRDIMMAAYDPTASGNFGILAASATSGNFTSDFKNDNGIVGSGETLLYQLYGNDALRRTPNGSAVAENIDALGFAYAFDNDGDGILDKVGGNIIWAIDTDNDGNLDKTLDTNNDGKIDENDMIGGNNLTPTISISKIRAIKVWTLARTSREDKKFHNTTTYVVSNQRIHCNDGFRRRLLSTTVKCRNMGL